MKFNSIKKCSLAAFLAVAMSFFFTEILGRRFASNIFGINEHFYLKYFYNVFNGSSNSDIEPDSLIIFDTQKYSSRADIASILEQIYQYEPAVIGVDLFFKESPDNKEENNHKLVDAVRRVKDKTVFVCNYLSNPNEQILVKKPFFHREPGLEDVYYASPLYIDYFEHYTESDENLNTGEPLPIMSYAVANHSHFKKRDYRGRPFYVNFVKKDFRPIIIDTITPEHRFKIKDRIVLVGNRSDMKDLSKMPFRFGNDKSISGVETIAYACLSLIQNTKKDRSAQMRFVGFQDYPFGVNILLAFIFSLAFAFYDNHLIENKKRTLKAPIGKGPKIGFILMLPCAVTLAEIILVFLCFGWTFLTNKIPDMFTCMVSIALISTSLEVSNIYYPTDES